GQRFRFQLRDVVAGGALAQLPSALVPLPTLQTILAAHGQINRIYIANTGDGLSGVGYSDGIAARMDKVLPRFLDTEEVKQEGVQYALQAEEIFNRILALYTLLALAVGLLLIFLIFALLAAERRVELATARALGLHRSQVVWILLFEGIIYSIAACAPGTLAGVGLGIAVIQVVGPTVAQFGLPLQVAIRPVTIVTAACLGLLFTLVTIACAVWAVSRVTIAAGLRDLPDAPGEPRSLHALALGVVRRMTARVPSATLITQAWSRLLWGLTIRGLIPLLVSLALIRWALPAHNALALAVGVSGAIASLMLVLRWLTLALGTGLLRLLLGGEVTRPALRLTRLADRLTMLLVGLGLVLYWSLPFDTFRRIGLPRFGGGIELFFAAGVLMILGTVLGLAPNLDVLLGPLRVVAKRAGNLRHVTFIALVYPSHQRFRSGLTIAMFSLVTFTMVVMACFAASTSQRYGNLTAQAGGYAIIGQPLFKPVGGIQQLSSAIRESAPAAGNDLAAISRAVPLPLIMIQPDAVHARWGVYPASAIDGAFLSGVGLPLVARAPGFASDADVWQAVRSQPGDVVIDVGAVSPDDLNALGITLPAPVSVEHFVAPPIASGLLGLARLEALFGQTAALAAQHGVPPDVRNVISDPNQLNQYTLHLQDIALGPARIAPTILWVADPRGGPPERLTVIGLVDNSRGQSYGLLGSLATFAPIEQGLAPFAGEYYFFKLAPTADVHVDSLAIGSALLAYGFQTTVIVDALADLEGPEVFASRVLIGLVGLTLLAGMIALAITGMRAVVERRQQVGMLRALGYRRPAVGAIFMIEAVVTAVAGTGIGLGLGLVLSRNVFAVNFFARFQAGLVLVVPWPALALICLVALAVAVIAALAPVAQVERVAPAEALRYE
ncbi:MAG TPA: ABC transporter permease, partial [Ktedonobacterales bacterium]|nr:ABC transporter permease [Ktedonobacterales bacterium]